MIKKGIVEKRLPIPRPSKDIQYLEQKIMFAAKLLGELGVIHIKRLSSKSKRSKDRQVWMNFHECKIVIEMVHHRYVCEISENGRYVFDPEMEQESMTARLKKQINGRQP